MKIKQAVQTLAIKLAFFLLQNSDEGGELMMAMFFAQRVILGKTAFVNVPAVLKPQVREILEDSGLGDLATEE